MVERKMIVGTEGNADYLLVTEYKGIQIGVKALFDPQLIPIPGGLAHTGNYIIGVRVRCAANSESETPLLNAGYAAVETFPHATFAKADPARASFMLVTLGPPLTNITVTEALAALEAGNFYDSVVESFKAAFTLEEGCIVPDEMLEEIKVFMKERYTEILGEIIGVPETPAPEPEGEKKGAKVLAFPSKK